MGTAKQPLVYEIHTAAFLHRLSIQYGRKVLLDSVPEQEWDTLADLGIEMIWLMGVWQRSVTGTQLSMADKEFLPELQRVIPGLTAKDVIGSAYCVRGYRVDAMFGGPAGLAKARTQLKERGIGLMLDFIPNHTAPDHPWVSRHPDYYVHGTLNDFADDPASYLHIGEHVIARGRDPHYAAWPDVVQLNAFSDGYRQAAVDTLRSMADHSDAVRCDMAMLMFNDIFEKTWGKRAGRKPSKEFWAEVISDVRKTHPDFIFLAESYWNTEPELMQQGFDYCYDKTLYDLLLANSPNEIYGYLSSLGDSQKQLCRFIENHDEQRAAAVYPSDRQRAAAVVIATLPGMHLLHDGQMEGFKTKIPVHVNHGPQESADNTLKAFYENLIHASMTWEKDAYDWHLWHMENKNVLAWEWRNDDTRHIVVVNYTDHETVAELYVEQSTSLTDTLTNEAIQADTAGHFTLSLEPWAVRLFRN